MRTWKMMVVVAAGAALVSGGVVVSGAATKTPPTWQYAACLVAQSKTLSRVTINATPSCPRHTRLITWNAQGPAGTAGVAGAPGPAGPAGPLSISAVSANDSQLQPGMPLTPLEFPTPAGAVGSDITSHPTGFVVNTAGSYLVTANVTADVGMQFAITVNGAFSPTNWLTSNGGEMSISQIFTLSANDNVGVFDVGPVPGNVTSAQITIVRLD